MEDAPMGDLVSMRAEAAEARNRIDTLLAVDGELSSEQVADLETADADFRKLQGEIQKREVVESARESLSTPTYDFRNNAERTIAKAPESRSLEEMYADAGDRLFRRLGGQPETRAPYDTATDSALVPVDLQNEMVRRLPKMTAAMNAATVVTEPHDHEIAAVVNRIASATIVDEAAAYTAAQATFDRIRFNAYKTAFETAITLEMFQDNRPSAMAETLLQHVEAHAEGWDALFLSAQNPHAARAAPGGLCATKAHIDAVYTATGINDVVMGSGDVAVDNITIQDLLDTQAAVPGKYRTGDKSWIMSPAVHARVIQSIDGDSRLVFAPQATGTLQEDPLSVGTLLGSPIYLSDNMPAAGANAIAALYLDRRSYRVALRQSFVTQEDPYSQGANGIVAYRSWMRADGQWTLPEASSRLAYAAS